MNIKTRYNELVASSVAGDKVRNASAPSTHWKRGAMLSMPMIGDVDMTRDDADKVKHCIAKSINIIGRAHYGEQEASQTLLNHIEAVSLLNPKVFSRVELQGEILASLWSAYAKIELTVNVRMDRKDEADGARSSTMQMVNALDNCHYIQSDIPCDADGNGSTFYKPRERWNGEKSKALPVSPRYRRLEMLKAGISESIPDHDLIQYTLEAMQNGKHFKVWQRPVTRFTNVNQREALLSCAHAFDKPQAHYRKA
jgi:hypothetical protein